MILYFSNNEETMGISQDSSNLEFCQLSFALRNQVLIKPMICRLEDIIDHFQRFRLQLMCHFGNKGVHGYV